MRKARNLNVQQLEKSTKPGLACSQKKKKKPGERTSPKELKRLSAGKKCPIGGGGSNQKSTRSGELQEKESIKMTENPWGGREENNYTKGIKRHSKTNGLAFLRGDIENKITRSIRIEKKKTHSRGKVKKNQGAVRNEGADGGGDYRRRA